MKWRLKRLIDLPFVLCYAVYEAWQMWRNEWLIHQKVSPLKRRVS